MRAFHHLANVCWKYASLGVIVTVLASAQVTQSGCHGGPATVMAQLSEANRLALELRVEFSKTSDASNRAVMADTDEASIAFAKEAQTASTAIEHDMVSLSSLLNTLGAPDAPPLLDQARKAFLEYRNVDSSILALAVENTNLKAQRLSFGAAHDAAEHFRAALTEFVPALAANERCRGQAFATRAELAILELETLQGPHIASSDDAAMTGIEQKMAVLHGTVEQSLSALPGVVEPSALAAAGAAFVQFKSIESQIVSLSRRNSNVRSLDLALRVKPPLTTACDDSLRKLQQKLLSEGSKATR